MNRLAVWVGQTAVGATVPMLLAQARASPLIEIDVGARLDPDIAASPLVAINFVLGLAGMARSAMIHRAEIHYSKFPWASDTLDVHLAAAANDSWFRDTNGSVPMPTRVRHR